MANKFPLILNTSANQIQEIASGDNLDLTGCGINNAGVITATSFSGNGSGLIGVASTDYIVTGTAATFNNTTNFNGNVNISSNIDVDGHTNLDNISVAGVSTFAGAIDLNADIDVDGHTNLDNVSIAGVSTFAGNVNANGNIVGDNSTNITGIAGVTATTLTGTLQTAAQTNITSVGTLSALTVSGNVNANGNIVGDNSTNITGIAGVTATTLTGTLQTAAQTNITSVGTLSALNVSGNVTAVDGTFSGNVSIGGTLTYEDVTNIDSVGLITARNGVSVTSGGIKVLAGISNFNANIVGTATTAISITAADESSDTSCNILFATAATGNVAPKTGTNLTFNSSNGTLTATTFSGSGASLTSVNATTLDSLDSSQFLRSDADDTTSGQLTLTSSTTYPLNINSTDDGKINLKGSSNPYIRFKEGTTDKAYIQWHSDGYLKIGNDEDSSQIRIKDTFDFSPDNSTFHTVVHAGNIDSYVGITTEQVTPSSGTATINLAKDDHKIVASGTYTINCTGTGTEANAHTIRVENTGISTVGFSTYFKFPSGGTPSLPTASGAISLISFTVHKTGAVGIATVLLAGASVNFS